MAPKSRFFVVLLAAAAAAATAAEPPSRSATFSRYSKAETRVLSVLLGLTQTYAQNFYPVNVLLLAQAGQHGPPLALIFKHFSYMEVIDGRYFLNCKVLDVQLERRVLQYGRVLYQRTFLPHSSVIVLILIRLGLMATR